MSNVHYSLPDSGYIEKSITVNNVRNGNYEIVIEAHPVGKSKEVTTLEFTRSGMIELLDSIKEIAERKVY